MKNIEQEPGFKKFFKLYKEKIMPVLEKYEDTRLETIKEYKEKNKILYISILTLINYIITEFYLFDFYLFDLSKAIVLNKCIISGFCITFIIVLFIYYKKKKHVYTNILTVYFIISFIILTVIASFLPNSSFHIMIINIIYILGFVMSIAGIVCFCYERTDIYKNYKNTIKREVKKYITQAYNIDEWHSYCNKCHDGVFPDMELNKSGLFIDFNHKFIDDEFIGKYKNVSFRASELKLIKIIHFDGKNCEEQVFKGVIIGYINNKKAKNRTVVASKWNLTKKQNFTYSLILTLLSSLEVFKHGYSHGKLILVIIFFIILLIIEKAFKKTEEPLNKITLEDPIFNRKFDVYSSDEVEARYLVTPLFMELLNNLKTAFGTKKIKCSFLDNSLIIAISTKKDLFEMGDLFIPYDNPKCIVQFYRELSSIYKMIEYFKLNEKKFAR